MRRMKIVTLLTLTQIKTMANPHIGHLMFTHGEIASRWSGMSAKRHYEKYGCCVIHGHTHRLGTFYHTNISNTFAAFENGCLSTLTPDYITAPDWQNGFSVLHHSNNYFHVDQIAIVRGQYCYGGKIYGKMKTVTSNIVEDLTIN